MFSLTPLRCDVSPGLDPTNNRASKRKAMYKKGTPPWRELHKQRLRERLRDGRHRLMNRLRGLDAPGVTGASRVCPGQDAMLAEWEQLQRDIIAEETDNLIQEMGGAGSDLTWAETSDFLLSERLACPLCQTTIADLTPDLRLICRCGLNVRVTYADLGQVRAHLMTVVEGHEAVCPEAEVFFTQMAGGLLMLCGECGLQTAALQ